MAACLFGARASAGERYEFDKLWFTIEDVGAQLAQLGYHDVPESIMVDFFRGALILVRAHLLLLAIPSLFPLRSSNRPSLRMCAAQ